MSGISADPEGRGAAAEISIAAMIDAAAHHLLSVSIAPTGTAEHHAPVATGSSLDREVQPGLRLAAHDLTWLADGDASSIVPPSVHCGILLEGESAPLRVEGQQPVPYQPLRAVVASFGEPTRCSRSWKGGTRSLGVGYVLESRFFDRFGDIIDPNGLDLLRDTQRHRFHYVQLPPSAELSEIAHQLVAHPYRGPVGDLFDEANTLRFLVETVGALGNGHRFMREMGRWHYERVCEAREILDQSLIDPPKSLDLARQVGVSLTTLQRNFKVAFGTTIFGHVRDRRLEIARALILDQGLGIAEAAYRVGYANAAAFTAAYRRRFGNPPSRENALKSI